MNIKNSEDPLSTHFFKIRLKAQPMFTRVKPMGKPGERWALLVYQIYKLCVMLLQRRFFFIYFHYKSMVDNDMPGAWPVWTPGAPLAAFIKESIIHWSTQHMKALGHMVSEKKIFFYVFPMTPPGGACMDPRGTVGRICSRIYKEDHFTLLHTKYESFGPCGFREEDFFQVFPTTPPYGPQGHGWQDL